MPVFVVVHREAIKKKSINKEKFLICLDPSLLWFPLKKTFQETTSNFDSDPSLLVKISLFLTLNKSDFQIESFPPFRNFSLLILFFLMASLILPKQINSWHPIFGNTLMVTISIQIIYFSFLSPFLSVINWPCTVTVENLWIK